jgi:hypothetical protein
MVDQAKDAVHALAVVGGAAMPLVAPLPPPGATATATATAAAAGSRSALFQWYCLDDVVMGGRSKSSVEVDKAGRLRFQGNISTIGGGFCSCRTHDETGVGLAGAEAVELIYTSDNDAGRYKVTMSGGSSAGGPRGVMWSCPLPVEAGRYMLNLPLSRFTASIRGRPVAAAETLNPADVRNLGVTCSIFDEHGQWGGGEFAFLLEKIQFV